MSEKNIDVLIVGAGPVGLFCANELLRHGLSCRIIDKKAGLSEHSKALALHIRSLSVFEDCGFIEQVLAQGHKVPGIELHSSGKRLIKANFNGINAPRDYLIDLPQNQTEAILAEALCNNNVAVEWECELTHLSQAFNEVTATIKKANNKIELLNANWLIACDGAHSNVRHQLNAEFSGAAYQQDWWLADLYIDWAITDNHMRAYLSGRGPLACFPMGNKRYRIVMTAPKDGASSPTLAHLAAEFKQRSIDTAVLCNPIWITPFTIHHRQIQQYQHDRVFFAGDAAHIHSPLGGQGLNTGIQDIYNLVWKLALVEKQQAKAELLSSYHQERFAVGQQVVRETDVMTRMVLLKNPVLVTLRNRLLAVLGRFSYMRKRIMTQLAQLSISYANSAIVCQSGKTKIIKAGSFLPQFQLINITKQELEHSQQLTQGTKHHLFVFAGVNAKKVDKAIQLATTAAMRYPDTMIVHLISTQPIDRINKDINLLLDTTNVHQQFGLYKPALVLVRPDKYIGLIQKSLDEQKFMDYLYLM